jgi:uncharacterized membrane protein YkvA (DUF1232 family)
MDFIQAKTLRPLRLCERQKHLNHANLRLFSDYDWNDAHLNVTGCLGKWKARARELRNDVYALYLAFKDPRVPWYAKALLMGIVGFAISPIDLIPDFIPVIGYLDDLVLIPLGIALAMRLVPPEVLAECREEARRVFREHRPTSKTAAAVIVLTWVGIAALILVWTIRLIRMA